MHIKFEIMEKIVAYVEYDITEEQYAEILKGTNPEDIIDGFWEDAILELSDSDDADFDYDIV